MKQCQYPCSGHPVNSTNYQKCVSNSLSFVGGNLSHFWCLASWVVEFNHKCPFNTPVATIEMTISGTFTCRCLSMLNGGFRLMKVSFKVNKENKFGDFGYYLLIRGCPLNTGFNVRCLLRIVFSPLVAMCFVQREVSSLKCIIFIDGG